MFSRSILLTVFALACFQRVAAQQPGERDSLPPNEITIVDSAGQNLVVQDSAAADKKTHRPHSVKKAVIQSALLPGLGQIYNKKWWKVPIIYAGFAGLGVAIGINTKEFRIYSDAYRIRVDGDTSTVDQFNDIYSESNLLTLKNYYKRNMNIAAIFTAVLYALNIADAAVDAHLFEYDISDDLTMKVEPVMRLSGEQSGGFAGMHLTMTF